MKCDSVGEVQFFTGKTSNIPNIMCTGFFLLKGGQNCQVASNSFTFTPPSFYQVDEATSSNAVAATIGGSGGHAAAIGLRDDDIIRSCLFDTSHSTRRGGPIDVVVGHRRRGIIRRDVVRQCGAEVSPPETDRNAGECVHSEGERSFRVITRSDDARCHFLQSYV